MIPTRRHLLLVRECFPLFLHKPFQDRVEVRHHIELSQILDVIFTILTAASPIIAIPINSLAFLFFLLHAVTAAGPHRTHSSCRGIVTKLYLMLLGDCHFSFQFVALRQIGLEIIGHVTQSLLDLPSTRNSIISY
jgi:hypothetical protein